MPIFLLLGHRGLNEPDEGRYGEIAREMLVTEDFLVPRIKGVPHYAKPPLTYQCLAASMALFGFNEWALRLPVALAALWVLWSTLSLGTRLQGRRVGWTATLGLAASLQFFALQRIVTTDMIMTALLLAALDAWLRGRQARERGESSVLANLGFWVLLGLAFLTKGPVPLLIVFPAILGATRLRGACRGTGWVWGLPLFLTVALSWFLYLINRDPGLWNDWLGREVVGRVSEGLGREKPLWYFAPVLLIGALPWTPFVLRAWFRPLEKSSAEVEGADPQLANRFTWHAVVWPLLVLSLSASKLWTYVLPLFPFLALRTAVLVDAMIRDGAPLPWWAWPPRLFSRMSSRFGAAAPFLATVVLFWIVGQAALLGVAAREDRLGHNTSYRGFFEALPEKNWVGAAIPETLAPDSEDPKFLRAGPALVSYRFRAPSAAIYLLRSRPEYLPIFGGQSLWESERHRKVDLPPDRQALARVLEERGELWVLTKTRYRAELLDEGGSQAINAEVIHAEGEGKRRVELLRLTIAD